MRRVSHSTKALVGRRRCSSRYSRRFRDNCRTASVACRPSLRQTCRSLPSVRVLSFLCSFCLYTEFVNHTFLSQSTFNGDICPSSKHHGSSRAPTLRRFRIRAKLLVSANWVAQMDALVDRNNSSPNTVTFNGGEASGTTFYIPAGCFILIVVWSFALSRLFFQIQTCFLVSFCLLCDELLFGRSMKSSVYQVAKPDLVVADPCNSVLILNMHW